MYRPEENWDEKITNENLPLFKQGTQEWLHTFHGVKIGADAMLKAQIRNVDSFDVKKGEQIETPSMMVSGTWVFIPDKEA